MILRKETCSNLEACVCQKEYSIRMPADPMLQQLRSTGRHSDARTSRGPAAARRLDQRLRAFFCAAPTSGVPVRKSRNRFPPEVVHTSKDFVGKKHTHSDMGVFQASHLSIMQVYNTNRCIHACMHSGMRDAILHLISRDIYLYSMHA